MIRHLKLGVPNDTRILIEIAMDNNLTIEHYALNRIEARLGDLGVTLSHNAVIIKPDDTFPKLYWQTGADQYPGLRPSNLVFLFMDKETQAAFQSFPKASIAPCSLAVEWAPSAAKLTRVLDLARHFQKSLSELLVPALTRAKTTEERLALLSAAVSCVREGVVSADNPQLAAYLRSYLQGEPSLAARAAALLGEEGIQLLLSRLKGDVHSFAYFCPALDALTAMGPRTAAPHLENLLRSEENVRRASTFIKALGQLEARASVPVIAETALRLDHEETTEVALETMARLDQCNPAVLPFLDHLLQARSHFYRQAARHARSMNHEEARSLLHRELMLPGLSTSNKKILIELLAASPQSSDTEAVQTAAAQGMNPQIIELAVRHFLIQDTRVLFEALALDDRALKERAVKLLGQVGDVDTVAPLCLIRDSSRGSLKKAAEEAVALIQGRLGDVEGGWLTLAKPDLEGSLTMNGGPALEGGLSPKEN